MLQSQAAAEEPAGLLVRGPVRAAADRHGPVPAAARGPDRHVPAHAPVRAGVVLQAVQRRRDLAAVGRLLRRRRPAAEAAARSPAAAAAGAPEVQDAVPREGGAGGYGGRDAAGAGRATVVVRGRRPVELPETDRRTGVPGGSGQGPRAAGVPDGVHEGPAARDRGRLRGRRETATSLRCQSRGQITRDGPRPLVFRERIPIQRLVDAIRRAKPKGCAPGRAGSTGALAKGLLPEMPRYYQRRIFGKIPK